MERKFKMENRLYRGKCQCDGGWVEGYLIKTTENKIFKNYNSEYFIVNKAEPNPCGVCIQETDSKVKEGNYSVIAETVGQYSGKDDDYGVKMFEDDIVEALFHYGCSVASVVAFQDGAFGLKWNIGGVEAFNAFACLCNTTYKVVGNIHDNSELLVAIEGR